MHVHIMQLLTAWLCDIEVERLSHVDPLLATTSTLNQPSRLNLERRKIYLLETIRNSLYLLNGPIEVLQIVDHILIPDIEPLKVIN